MIAFLPIKHHSERIPNKNFKTLGNAPLYSWILNTLLNCNSIKRIVIDTDSDDRNLWALQSHPKIEIIERAQDLVGDFISMNLLIERFLNSVDEMQDLIMTHTTNPFLQSETIENAIDSYSLSLKNGVDSLFSVSEFRGRFYDSHHFPLNHNPDELIRTQDLEPLYLENSCLYVFSKKSFLESKSRIGKRAKLFVTPVLDSLDIDTPDDWNLAVRVAASMKSPTTILI